MKPPKAKLALFFSSEGVAAGRATMTARQSLTERKEESNDFVIETITTPEWKITYRTFNTT